MAFQVLTTTAASITELKRDPMGTFHAGDGAPVAILNRNEPAFYCVPPALYAQLMELLEDEELGRMADERSGEKVIEVNIDDYKLAFNESALKEWKKLGHTLQVQFKKKLKERLENPRVPASQLHGRKDQYKIKLRGAGYRLVGDAANLLI